MTHWPNGSDEPSASSRWAAAPRPLRRRSHPSYKMRLPARLPCPSRFVYGGRGGRRLTPPAPPITPVTESSILTPMIMATHTPGADEDGGLTEAVHTPIAEDHDPRDGKSFLIPRRRPIVGRLDVGKGMAQWEERARFGHGWINQTSQLVHRGQAPAFPPAGGAARARKTGVVPIVERRQRRLFPHQPRFIIPHR